MCIIFLVHNYITHFFRLMPNNLLNCVELSGRALVKHHLMWRVVTLSRIEDLEAQILDRDLPMLDGEQLTHKGLKVVFYFDQKIRGLLQSDVQFSLLV